VCVCLFACSARSAPCVRRWRVILLCSSFYFSFSLATLAVTGALSNMYSLFPLRPLLLSLYYFFADRTTSIVATRAPSLSFLLPALFSLANFSFSLASRHLAVTLPLSYVFSFFSSLSS
jgi:hypothetical protein